MTEWPLQDAKNQFSVLVNAALAGEPQLVTRRGQPAVVVLAADEYERLRLLDNADAPTLANCFSKSHRTTMTLSGCRFPPDSWMTCKKASPRYAVTSLYSQFIVWRRCHQAATAVDNPCVSNQTTPTQGSRATPGVTPRHIPDACVNRTASWGEAPVNGVCRCVMS